MRSNYVCPQKKRPLQERDSGLLRDDGNLFPFLKGKNNINIPNFLDTIEHGEAAKKSLEMYDQEASLEIYRNFLNWLFQTFNEDETSFRANLISKLQLKKGNRVLITGCGLGDDIKPIADIVGSQGEVYANDLAAKMVVEASHQCILSDQQAPLNIHFSICDAQSLPFQDHFFDGAFHFGGINLFDDMQLSISEMNRVVKPGGRVVFGDEGVAPWLRDTEYGKLAINNNSLWAANAPLDFLPANCLDVHMSWVLGNCFYVIDFEVSETGPFMDIGVHHIGPRGGNMGTRYFGNLEGVTNKSKEFVIEDAARKGISIHDWLEQVIQEKQKH